MLSSAYFSSESVALADPFSIGSASPRPPQSEPADRDHHRRHLRPPERVHQGDIVLRLSEGVERAERTLSDYVVTEQLAGCFDDALPLIGSAFGANISKGAYLHGSFGSGKSHFMAVLTLLRRRTRLRVRSPGLSVSS